MPEERGLYPKMRVVDQLVFLGRLSGLSAAAAARQAGYWLDALGLGERKASRLDDLSHGNQQRVQLAAALVHAPELLVLDEPFSGLDPLAMDSMSALLHGMARAGAAVLFSSYQLAVLLVVAVILIPSLIKQSTTYRVGLAGTAPAGVVAALEVQAGAVGHQLEATRYANLDQGERAVRAKKKRTRTRHSPSSCPTSRRPPRL